MPAGGKGLNVTLRSPRGHRRAGREVGQDLRSQRNAAGWLQHLVQGPYRGPLRLGNAPAAGHVAVCGVLRLGNRRRRQHGEAGRLRRQHTGAALECRQSDGRAHAVRNDYAFDGSSGCSACLSSDPAPVPATRGRHRRWQAPASAWLLTVLVIVIPAVAAIESRSGICHPVAGRRADHYVIIMWPARQALEA
jgi:hypothetical protein